MNRRQFLAGAVATGLSLGVASQAGALAVGVRARRVPLTRLECRVVVIGSGFGGGVAALRLGEASVPVLVLERGIRWPTGPNAETFPHATRRDSRMSWLGSPMIGAVPVPAGEPFTGLLERAARLRPDGPAPLPPGRIQNYDGQMFAAGPRATVLEHAFERQLTGWGPDTASGRGACAVVLRGERQHGAQARPRPALTFDHHPAAERLHPGP